MFEDFKKNLQRLSKPLNFWRFEPSLQHCFICLCVCIDGFRIHEKFVVHSQDAKAAVFEELCDKFLQCLAFEGMERTPVSTAIVSLIYWCLRLPLGFIAEEWKACLVQIWCTGSMSQGPTKHRSETDKPAVVRSLNLVKNCLHYLLYWELTWFKLLHVAEHLNSVYAFRFVHGTFRPISA